MKSPKAILFKILKTTGISTVTVLLLMFLLPILFPDAITEKIKTFANENIDGKISFSKANLSFFHHFPSLTLTLNDFSLKGSKPFENETLVASKEIAFGINVKSLVFNKTINIDKIFVDNAVFNVKVNAEGQANYNVYKSNSKAKPTDTTSTSIRLEKIDIKNTHFVYDDKSTKILIDAKGFNYDGNGDLDQSIFDLYSKANINSFDLTFDGQPYLTNKKVNADLITKINTNSLAFVFKQNDLKINKLPVDFKGSFDFLKNGYFMDFNVKSTNSKLNDFFTALPPQYIKWLEKTKIEGDTDILLTLKGKYIEEENKKPDLNFNMKIRNGAVAYDNAPIAATNIFLNFDTKLPSLDTKDLSVKIDSFFFNVGKEYVAGILDLKGIENPIIAAKIRANIDLEKMNRAFGLQNLDLKGNLFADIKANGEYNKNKNRIPILKGNLKLNNGLIKTEYYPTAISKINMSIDVQDKQGNLKDLYLKIAPASFVFEGKPFYLNATFQNFEDINYDLKAKGELDVAKIYKVFSQKGLSLNGYIKADVAFKGKQSDATKGNYSKLKNKGTLVLRNIKTKSQYLPKPFIINKGTFTFNQDKMKFKNFVASYGTSDFVMNGAMQNVINFVLSKNAVLKGNFNLKSNYINVDEFMSATAIPATNETKNTSPSTSTGVVIIPPNLNLNFVANAQKVDFDKLKLNKLKGNLTVANGKMYLKEAGFNLIGCNVLMDVVYKNETQKRAFFDYQVKADSFDIKRAYNEIEMFRNMASAAKSAQGLVSLDYKVSGKLNKDMKPIYPSLAGGGTLSVKNVKMRGFKMFNAVSRKTGKTSIKNPDVSKVDIKTTIKNNIITIERFKFKFAGFRPRIEGTTSFDGKLNIKMRLGIPPLGIIGIPLRVTGTQENPKVRLGRKSEDLKETEYKEGEEE